MRNKFYLILLFLLSIITILPLLRGGTHPALSVDGNGHLFKIHKLMYSGWKPWIDDWYVGIPFLRFYPPASYILAAALGKLTSHDITGYAATLFITSFIGALVLHIYLKKRKFEAYLAPILFLLLPWRLGVELTESNFPRANALNLSPLILLAFLWLGDRRERYILASALSISIVALTHHSILIPLFLIALVLHGHEIFRIQKTGNIIRAVGVVVTLTNFWYIPFLYDRRWAHFIDIGKTHWLFNYTSVSPSRFLLPYIGIPLLVGLLFGLTFKKIRREYYLLLISAYLSLGAHSPTKWIYLIPPINLIPPYRWLDLQVILIPLIIAGALRELKWRKAAGIILIMLFAGLSISAMPVVHSIDSDTLRLSAFLKAQEGHDWRFYVIPANAIASYLPAITGKRALNGWYMEGNPAEDAMGHLWYLLAKGDNKSILYLKAYSVRYFITADPEIKLPRQNPFMKIGKYNIYKLNTSFIQEIDVLLVGRFYDLPFKYAYLKKLPRTIGGIDTIIYAGEPSRKEEKFLKEFVRTGGTLIWVPEINSTLFGINANVSVINPAKLSSYKYNVSKMGPFEYHALPWYGPVFSNVSPLIRLGNLTFLGIKRFGNGTVYFVGGNLLYHALYHNSTYEIKLLEGLIRRNRTLKAFKIKTLKDGIYRIHLEVTGKTLLRISEAYYPYWKLEMEGKPLRILRDERTGLTLVEIKRDGDLIGEVRDPFVKLRLYSLLGWVFISLYTLAFFLVSKKGRITT